MAIRVLLIAPSMNILGGQAVQAKILIEQINTLADLRMDFLPINPRLPGPLRHLQRFKYVRTVATWLWYIPLLLGKAMWCDVVHVFSAGLTSFSLWTIPAAVVSRLYGKKLIIHYHDGQLEEHLARFRSVRPVLALAHAIITPSGFLTDVFARHGIHARPILNNLEMNLFHYRPRRKLRPVFMTNRILEPLYNVECILRAFAIVQQQYPEAELTIAHDGICRPALEQYAASLQLKNVRFVGRIPHDQVASLYDAADIYLTSPNFDCMPGSILECYASGLPIVATKAGGIPYIAFDEETALLVDLNDHEAMAARCFRLLEDEDLVERLTNRARQELVKYTPETVRDEWAALYRELVGPGKERGI
jgi:glycosyltransferase involved in cell wall biosynthesis